MFSTTYCTSKFNATYSKEINDKVRHTDTEVNIISNNKDTKMVVKTQMLIIISELKLRTSSVILSQNLAIPIH